MTSSETVSIDSDHIGRAHVRLSKNPEADKVFRDIEDGIITKCSFMYQVYKYLVDEETEFPRFSNRLATFTV